MRKSGTGSIEFAKASGFENAALLMKDLIFNLGPVYPALYPLAARFFRLADQNENAMQMVKVAEGLNLGTNALVIEKAMILEALKDEENAERAYQEVMTIDPGNFNALLFLMRKYNRDKNPQEALSLSRIFEAKYPDNGYGFLEKAKSLIIGGQSKAAQTALAKSESLLPDNVEARVLMGDLYMQENDYNSALKHYSKAVSLAPQDLDAGLKTSRAYMLSGDSREALEILRKISNKYYDNSAVQKELGLAEYKVGDKDAARRALNRYVQGGGSDLTAFLALANIYDGAGQYVKALEMYEKALPIDDNKSMAQRRIDMEKTKTIGKEEEKPVYDGQARAATSRFNKKLVVRILTAAVCVGGIAGGYLMNNKIKDTQTKYDNDKNTADVDSYHNDLKNQQTMRLLFYCLGAGAGAGFTVTFFIK
jgi:tetratricopeptide (TPR) repeat protein